MAATNTESHSFILLSTRQWNDSLNGSAAAKWPIVIVLGLHRLEKMLKIANVINILWPCRLTASVITRVYNTRTRPRMILTPLPHMWCIFHVRLIRKISPWRHAKITIYKASGFPLQIAEIKRKIRMARVEWKNQTGNIFDCLYSAENYTTLGPVLFLYSINFT